MPEPDDLDKVLGFLRELSEFQKVDSETRQAAKECREILLKFKRNEEVDASEVKDIQRRFIDNFETIEQEFATGKVTVWLNTFAISNGVAEMDVELDGKLQS